MKTVIVLDGKATIYVRGLPVLTLPVAELERLAAEARAAA